jgi:hypothetical protein
VFRFSRVIHSREQRLVSWCVEMKLTILFSAVVGVILVCGGKTSSPSTEFDPRLIILRLRQHQLWCASWARIS